MAKKKKKRCKPGWPDIIKAAQREAISRELAAQPIYRERALDDDTVTRYIHTLKAEN